MVIGMTIVAMGSSAPEIMVAATASLADSPDTAVGNAIGSNITNIMLVLAITALMKPIVVRSGTIRRELPLLMIVSLIAAFFLADYVLNVWEGGILIVLFFSVLGGLTWLSIRADRKDPLAAEMSEEIPEGVSTVKASFWVVVGLLILPISASYMVDSAVTIARYFGMSDLIIGLTIIAIGTSLPELAASIAGVLKGEDDLAMGNIIGSNIFNILAVLAMPALIAPGAIDPDAITRDIYVMLAATFLMVAFSFNIGGNRNINRWQGGLLLAGFIAYQSWLFLSL